MEFDALVVSLAAQADGGEQGDAIAIGDEFENCGQRGGGEGAALEIGLEGAGIDHLVAQAVAFFKKQEFVARQIGEVHRIGEGGSALGGEHEGIGKERDRGEIAFVEIGADESDVDIAICQGRHEAIGLAFVD